MSGEPKPLLRNTTFLAAEYLAAQMRLAGVPSEHFAIGKEKVRAKLDESWMIKNGCSMEWLDDIYNPQSSWAKTRLIILIDGGSIIDRSYVAQAFLFRSVVNNASSGNSSCLVKRSDELVTVFSQFGDERVGMLDRLRTIQCLLISEVSEHVPKSNAFGNLYFNEVLQTRQEANRPTVLTFATKDIEDRNYGEFSRLLDEVIKQPNSGLRKTYRFRVAG